MTKQTKDDIRAQFRNSLNISEVNKVKKDPNYEYKLVITTYEHDPDRVGRYMDNGWDIVFSEDSISDERTNIASEKSSEGRIRPVTKRLKGGHQAVLMRCSKERRQQNEAAKTARDKEAFLKASGRKIRKEGSNIIVQESDINLDSPE